MRCTKDSSPDAPRLADASAFRFLAVKLVGFVLVGCVIALGGCTRHPRTLDSSHVVFVVHGAGGFGSTYNDLIDALDSDEDSSRTVRLFRWGAPGPLFMFNFSNQSIHDKAERELASEIQRWQAAHADGDARVDLVGHSAGCGVILGALAQLDKSQVDRVILLHPSVSPMYPLSGAVAHVRSTMHVFYSDRDTVFLKWRCSQFGTYDRVKTPAAGYMGFDLANLPGTLRERVHQHAHQGAWSSLGDDGGHFGALNRPFVNNLVVPLLR